MGTAIKHPVPDRIKPSFLFLTSGHSDAHCPVKIGIYLLHHKIRQCKQKTENANL